VTVPRLAARAWPPGPQYHPVMGAVAPVPRICGREAEIGALGEALGRVAAGGPAVVLVEGEAGIGKTRLLAEALADAAGRGTQGPRTRSPTVTYRAWRFARYPPYLHPRVTERVRCGGLCGRGCPGLGRG
jgi:AAA ATPase domain